MSKLTITMLSDWHVGSGTGRPGNIDRLIQRDRHNLPYIPAKTLTGILRDGCELVAAGLDEGQEGEWHNYLEYLFGSQPAIAQGVVEETPITAALSLRSAYLPKTLSDALRGQPELISALTFVKPGVAIDSNLGTAEPDCLRFEEMARAGSYLEAEYQLNFTRLEEEQIKAAKALLVAGVSTIERLGGKRRRGAGRCRIKLSEENLETALKYLDTNLKPPKLLLESIQTKSKSKDIVNSKKWYTIEIQLETQSPLIVHARTLGNLVSTLDYIPGTALLPIISRQLGKIIDLRSAIANNQIVASNATLEVDGKQGRSVPFALFQEKQKKQVIYNRLGEPFERCVVEYFAFLILKMGCYRFALMILQQRPQQKGMRSGYISDRLYASPSKAVNTHNIVDDKVQRPNEEVGGVYSYEAIAAHTKFRAKIHIQDTVISSDKFLACLLKLVATQTEIGRSKKDDYGLVKITAVNPFVNENPNIELIPGELRVWLLSDVLIRNSRLRPSTEPQDLATELGSKLGVSLTLKPNCLSSLARSRRTDSWQTRWGLPRPSLVGLSAGSCFLFEVTGEIDVDKLTELQLTGIGERRAEGYGQLCFNDLFLMNDKPSLSEVSEDKPPGDKGVKRKPIDPQNLEIYNYAQTIEKEAWREAIRRQSVSLAADPQQRKELLGIEIDRSLTDPSKPSMSQLGVLRSIVMNSLDSDPTQNSVVNNWIDKLPQKIKDKWGKDSLAKVRKLLITPNEVWALLECNISFDLLTLTEDGRTSLKEELWRETVQILVMDCIRAHKRDLEPKKESTNNGTQDNSTD